MVMIQPFRRQWLLLLLIFCTAHSLKAQFTNRYPKVETYRHHIYLEAFEFPFYSNGPVAPVASPDDNRIAFSAFGWLWVYDRSNGKVSRITSGQQMDFLPCWSPDGQELAFVRDSGRETNIVVIDLKSGDEVLKIDHPNASELDPYFSPDGQYIYYTTSAEGTFDIWRINLTNSQKEKLTKASDGIEMRPVPFGDKGSFYYISKAEGVVDRIKLYNAETKSTSIVDEGRILSQLWMDTNSDGEQLALNWSNALTWDLFIKKGIEGAPKLELFSNEFYVTYPSWNRKNKTILFSMAEENLVFSMYEIPEKGGQLTKIEIKEWDYNSPLNETKIKIIEAAEKVNARVSMIGENGHYLIPNGVVPRFDSQNGDVYFYTDGEFTISVPSNKIKIKASHGLFSFSESDWINLSDNAQINISLNKGWSNQEWYAGDHHFHLNYGGPFKLQPDDLVPILKAEALDFGTPMVANLHFQLKDKEYLQWNNETFPKIRFGQEVRSHFHGHIGLFGNNDLFFPWFWGPVLYETNTYDDRTNNEALIFGRTQGEIGAYVHPIGVKNPIADEASMASVPIGLIADVVNENLDAFEMACLWSDEIGSSIMYHQFLNLGIPVSLTAGTDAFPGYARCMAVGTTRLLVNTGGKSDWETYLDGIRKGRSVVTNGPMIELKINGKIPGEVIESTGKVNWEMEVFTGARLDKIQLLVNGTVVWEAKQSLVSGSKTYSGKLSVPVGGWIAARVYGESTKWPIMDSYNFAHTSPIWVGKIGSYDPKVRKESATLLLKMLELSWDRLVAGYKTNSVENQKKYFDQARAKLQRMIQE